MQIAFRDRLSFACRLPVLPPLCPCRDAVAIVQSAQIFPGAWGHMSHMSHMSHKSYRSHKSRTRKSRAVLDNAGAPRS